MHLHVETAINIDIPIMIKSIKLKKEKSCYKGETILDTNNMNVVLIYGLNGTGKSTIASYLHSFPECSNFSDCSINPNLGIFSKYLTNCLSV